MTIITTMGIGGRPGSLGSARGAGRCVRPLIAGKPPRFGAEPARTITPEVRFARAIAASNEAFQSAIGTPPFRSHPQHADLLARIHRFRAHDRNGLYSLAKDVARLTADSLDAKTLQKIVPPPKGEKWGSLKSLEKVLATKMPPDDAHTKIGPLFGAYDLRLADAHLPSEEVDAAMLTSGIDSSTHPVRQGLQLIDKCAEALEAIASAMTSLSKADAGDGAP